MVKIASRLFNQKMLVLSKISLTNFIYHIIDALRFPGDIMRNLYLQSEIIKYLLYLSFTDTDSAALQLDFISHLNCAITENHARQLLFKIILASKIKDWLDLAHYFSHNFFPSKKQKLQSWVLWGRVDWQSKHGYNCY